MACILNIDTALETAGISLVRDGKVVLSKMNPDQRDHAAWIHAAIRGLLEEAKTPISHLDAVAVSAGPGSYTGLRVGMATAKGLCYAGNLALILVNTLDIMAEAGKPFAGKLPGTGIRICPMIDARRMEVFTAIYSSDGKLVCSPQAMILDANSFEKELLESPILFFGSGSRKWQQLVHSGNAIFEPVQYSVLNMTGLSQDLFEKKLFASLEYAEPIYLKEFYTHPAK